MPELPEVETVCRGLARTICGQTITHAKTYWEGLRFAFPRGLTENLIGKTIHAVERRAKYILVHLKPKGVLLIHLGMSGRIFFSEPAHYKKAKHDHFLMEMDHNTILVYHDPRRFGVIDYIPDSDQCDHHRLLHNLGAEPLSDSFDGEALFQWTRGKKAPVKNTIMNAQILVGVGNIYASESLYHAGISPFSPSNTLTKSECRKLAQSIKFILQKAIDAGGSSLKDYVATDGSLGRFQHGFKVYGRDGKNCPRQGCPDHIQKMTQQGRSTFYCPSCQKQA